MDSLYDFVKGHAYALLIATVLFGAYYQFCLTRALPGIPHGTWSRLNPLGDVPAVIRYFKKHGSVFHFLVARCVELDSPVIQLILGGSTFVVVSDLRETRDVSLYRSKEFGHANRQNKTFDIIAENSTIAMMSNADFWAQRRMWNKLMTVPFLYKIAAPHLHGVFSDLIRLWDCKSALSCGQYAFNAVDDIHDTLMDSMWAILTGEPMGIVKQKLRDLKDADGVDLPKSPTDPVQFPAGTPPRIAAACRKLIEYADPLMMSPAPDLQRWSRTLTPSFRRAKKLKVEAMTAIIEASRKKFESKGTSGPAYQAPTSGIDYIHCYGISVEQAENQPEAQSDKRLQDEMFMFLVAGLNSTSLALTWGLKLLADAPECQSRLRQDVLKAFPEAACRLPSSAATEIVAARIPYLEAVIWEILRLSRPAPAIVREATVDTQLLGYHIPAGTDVIFTLEGESFLHDQALPVPEDTRSAGARAAQANWPKPWPVAEKRVFVPERWLTRDQDGKETFDPRSGPNMPFSVGPRSCYGQKLVMVMMRLFLVLVMTSFDFHQVPQALAAYEANEVLTRKPKHGYIKIKSLMEVVT